MINEQIGKYKLLKLIGEGGMASVYEAEHVKLGNKVAVKILDEVLVKKGNIKERFENEAKIMASLEHANIVRVIDYEETDTSLAIVMELIKGNSLTEYIKQKGALQPEEAIRLQKILLETFAYAHHNSIVHRDVKPSNIIIETDKNNNPKILDFGIAKLLQSDANLTSTGIQMGTPLYMSPEQVKDSKDIDHRTDIYSLGVVFYYMLSGKPPYDSSTMSNFDIFSKIVHEPMPKLEKYPKLNQIIQKATSKELNNRYQTCEEFIVNLENYKEHKISEKQENNKSEDETIIDTSNFDNEETIIEQDHEKKQLIADKNIFSSPKEHLKVKRRSVKTSIIVSLTIIITTIVIIIYLKLENNKECKHTEKVIVYDSFTDTRDGHVYKTIQIDNQIWMAENLVYKPNHGNYWAYDNDKNNIVTYGYLYDWETARKIVPTGWHLPTNHEYKVLIGSVSGEDKNAYCALNLNGNSGFSSRFGGSRWELDGSFSDMGTNANYWSTSEHDNETAGYLYINSYSKSAGVHESGRKGLGFSVRCLKD